MATSQMKSCEHKKTIPYADGNPGPAFGQSKHKNSGGVLNLLMAPEPSLLIIGTPMTIHLYKHTIKKPAQI